MIAQVRLGQALLGRSCSGGTGWFAEYCPPGGAPVKGLVTLLVCPEPRPSGLAARCPHRPAQQLPGCFVSGGSRWLDFFVAASN